MTLIQFDDASGRRIGSAVRFVEDQANRRKPLTFSPILTSDRRTAVPIRVGEFEGAWYYNQTKQVVYMVGTSTASLVAINKLFTVGDSCDKTTAYVGRVDGGWHLLNVQHVPVEIVVNVSQTATAISFERSLVWEPQTGVGTVVTLPINTSASCSG